MKKYNIDKSFGLLKHFNPPFNKAFFGFANFILKLLPKKLKSTPELAISKIKIKTSDNSTIKLYRFTPSNASKKCMLYIHGGGFCYESVPYQYNACKNYAKHLKCTCIYVNYRLAPKHAYPIPFEDCYDTYKWIVDNAKQLNIDPNKIIVAGDSAGGCIAAEVCKLASERNLPKPCFALLIYPVLDKSMSSKTNTQFTKTPVWNANKSRKMWQYLLKGKNPTLAYDKKDLSFMPPSYIETTQYDCLRGEAEMFANRLKDSGIKTTLYQTQHTMHGYDVVAKSPISKQSMAMRLEVLSKIK